MKRKMRKEPWRTHSLGGDETGAKGCQKKINSGVKVVGDGENGLKHDAANGVR